jgi:DNA polymerase
LLKKREIPGTPPNRRLMITESPRHCWNNTREAALVADMVAKTGEREVRTHAKDADKAPRFAKRLSAKPARETTGRETPEPPREPVAQLRTEAETCTRCPLYKNATQTVFGEGPQPCRTFPVAEHRERLRSDERRVGDGCPR